MTLIMAKWEVASVRYGPAHGDGIVPLVRGVPLFNCLPVAWCSVRTLAVRVRPADVPGPDKKREGSGQAGTQPCRRDTSSSSAFPGRLPSPRAGT